MTAEQTQQRWKNAAWGLWSLWCQTDSLCVSMSATDVIAPKCPFYCIFKICLHVQLAKQSFTEEDGWQERLQYSGRWRTLFTLLDLALSALTPLLLPLERTWRNLVLRLQNATNQTAVVASDPSASGSSERVKCKELALTEATRPLQTRICLLPLGRWETLAETSTSNTKKPRRRRKKEDGRAGRLGAIYWGVSVGTEQQVAKHTAPLEWCSRHASECHHWGFDFGFFFGGVNISLTSILPEKEECHCFTDKWKRKEKKKSQSASRGTVGFTIPAAKPII